MICSLHAFCLPFAVQVCRSMALYTSPSPVLLFLSQFWNAYLLYPFCFFTLDSLSLLFLLLTSHFLPTGWSWCIHVVITPADMWRGSMLQTQRLLNCDQLFACCLTSFLTWRRKKTKNMHKYRCRCTYVNVHIRQIKTRSDVHPPLCVFTTSAVQIFD